MKKILFISTILILITSSCNKDKSTSKKFWKGQRWNVTVEYPKYAWNMNSDRLTYEADFYILECDIYDELCESVWKSSNGDLASFYWQFNENAKEIKIARSNEGDTVCSGCNEADYFAFQFSGKYNVLQSKKKEMIFESTETIGYAGKTVKMILQKVE